MSGHTVEVLREAAKLLRGKGWTQGAFARDKDAETCSADESAVCYCAVGAIFAASPDVRSEIDAERALADVVLGRPCVGVSRVGVISQWNDAHDRTLDEVLNAFEAAINKAEGR